jgi:capsular exopolysaccharide synthesis family protein
LLGEAVTLNYESNGYTSSYGEQDTIPNPINEAKKQGSRKTKAKVHKSRMVGVVGPQGGEGVSVVAANLAVTLAGQGRVLLVDANASHPSAHEFFGMKVSLGLVDVLADSQNWQHAIGKTPVANLDLMPIGTAQESVSEADMDKLRQTVMLMNRQYDYIVVDLPPMDEAGYIGRLARLCDNVGLVVEAERSRWEVVQRTKEQLERLHANVSGVVLNKRRYPIPEWLYRAV